MAYLRTWFVGPFFYIYLLIQLMQKYIILSDNFNGAVCLSRFFQSHDTLIPLARMWGGLSIGQFYKVHQSNQNCNTGNWFKCNNNQNNYYDLHMH